MLTMATDFQSSFIPKGPVTTDEVFKKKKAGVFGVLVVALFISSIVISGALYFYKGVLKNEIENMQAQLSNAEKSIDRETIGNMLDFSKKLETVRSIVSRHKVINAVMGDLASSTVASVYFTDFNYSTNSKGSLSIMMHGKAAGYGAVALQEEIFKQNKYFESVSFSNLSLDDKGFVSFDLSIVANPQIASYSL